MSRNPEYDVTLDGVGYILTRDGLGVSRVQANPYAMKSSSGERTYADLDEWAVFQVSSCHRGMGIERYGDPEQFWYALRVDTRFKNKIFLGPRHLPITLSDSSQPKVGSMHYAHLGTKFFCGCDDIVYELSGGDWVARDEVSGEDITSMVAFNGYLYVARADDPVVANVIRKTADGTNWSDVGDSCPGKLLYVHGGYLYRTWDYSVLYSSDPEAASPTWSSPISIGSTDYGTESMCTYQNSLIVFKNDGAWRVPGNPGDLDTAYRIPELDWRGMLSTTNGRSSCVWTDGFLYVIAGSSVLRWTGRTVTPIGTDLLLTGKVKGIACDLLPMSTSLFCYVNDTNGTHAHVLAWNGSGWHHVVRTTKAVTDINAKLYHFNHYLYTGHDAAANNITERSLLPTETQDPTQDTNYVYLDTAYGGGYFYSPKFTANLHDAQKEFRSFYIWLDNLGQGAVSSTQQVIVYYRVDTDDDNHWITLGTYAAADGGKEVFKTNFPSGDFTDKTIGSIDGDNDTITLGTGESTSDIAEDEWVYIVNTNEYRQVVNKTASPATITLQCPLDSTPTTDTIIRPGIPMGRFIQFKFYLTTTANARTPAVLAWGLKYLVNIGDYDIWQLNVQVSDPLTLRNGNAKRQPISDQLTHLNEIRKKGRVTFVDEVGDSHTVKVTNYSLQPVRQRADSKMEPEAGYAAKLTLLEV